MPLKEGVCKAHIEKVLYETSIDRGLCKSQTIGSSIQEGYSNLVTWAADDTAVHPPI